MTDVQCLSFSGGWQSSALAWMVVRGELELPRHFAIVTADTGDERQATYDYWRRMAGVFVKAGIEWLEAPGPKITSDWHSASGVHRLDMIPYWVNNNGKRGQLQHGCTRHYKIRPIRRAVNKWLTKRLHITKGRAQSIRKTMWIGMAADEQHRFDKIEETRTWLKRAPLIERGMTKSDCVAYIRDNALPEPIMSVCAGCFGHGLRSLRWMKENDPVAWERIKDRDAWVRNGLAQFGVKYPVYISDTLIPLQELEDRDFQLDTLKETAKHECASGVCYA